MPKHQVTLFVYPLVFEWKVILYFNQVPCTWWMVCQNELRNIMSQMKIILWGVSYNQIIFQANNFDIVTTQNGCYIQIKYVFLLIQPTTTTIAFFQVKSELILWNLLWDHPISSMRWARVGEAMLVIESPPYVNDKSDMPLHSAGSTFLCSTKKIMRNPLVFL